MGAVDDFKKTAGLVDTVSGAGGAASGGGGGDTMGALGALGGMAAGGGFSGSSGVSGDDEVGATLSIGGKYLNFSGPNVGSPTGINTTYLMIGGVLLGALYLYTKGRK